VHKTKLAFERKNVEKNPWDIYWSSPKVNTKVNDAILHAHYASTNPRFAASF